MNILLMAMNAKYIHSNLAVYSLRTYAKSRGVEATIAEYTINQTLDSILQDLYKHKPDLLAVSCYIWNITHIEKLIEDFHKICPEVPIWLGGPEVSYQAETYLQKHPEVTGIICGEGEASFTQLCKTYQEKKDIQTVSGIAYRQPDGSIHQSSPAGLMRLDDIPFCYDDLEEFENRIIYYESSRGCPFRCSYCLSSIDKRVRFRSLSLVEKELQFFIEHKVPQVKFVDRTFNANKEHAMRIWKYILEHDNGITNFHFEVAADLLTKEELELLSSMRPGLVQLEVGVQTTNEQTLEAIQRKTNLQKIWENAEYIHKCQNIHLHLDLIAGLPFEDLESFKKSFADVYRAKPEQLQLGFLKVLKGADMYLRQNEYDMVYTSRPPYEVLFTRWLSYEDVVELKAVEEMVENYYNSGQFTHVIKRICKEYENPYEFYKELAGYYQTKKLDNVSHSRMERYKILLGFIEERLVEVVPILKDFLVYDLYLREKVKSRPDWAPDANAWKEEARVFYRQEKEFPTYLENYTEYDEKQMMRMTHIEHFSYNVLGDGEPGSYMVLFDYQVRNPLNKEARHCLIIK